MARTSGDLTGLFKLADIKILGRSRKWRNRSVSAASAFASSTHPSLLVSTPAMTMKSIVLASMGLLILAAPAWAVAPVVRLIQPVGGQRGTEVAVTLSGQRLNDIQEILFYQPGITVTKIVGGQEPRAVVTFKISETAALGLHDFRVRTATGVSSLKTFSVGTLKEVAEVEPNNDFAKPQKIDMNVTVNGVAGNEDIDYYEVRATKGERITVEVEGIRLGLTLFDPYVAISEREAV